ncbi:prephenate dehydrogenase/arogenate dehydrogenase family protein [candidate division KSB1 bacterium]|nr:prephenate dehydrogenase/arogenate dehydrogenase family protein [candidate division KSB1 bacterium]NIR72123.1 prephenate dehydrogenase/arogenate dehydrogenase family protein [candidate division KSB1 bacterium]NIS26592.1 prephenate dehydrogenase/arogenate dehydrogenase family protein [candidate division KSB1 bacterium]NIT73359.1 prephenate dehydrogenase/arogenate dehydrogenase family protein [candidate division KSB1 bacterium]NIU27208.1 prephenate dehydrogenase/arogenate dehydrogenase family 
MKGLSKAQLVILAIPIRGILDLLPKIGENVNDGTLITDVGSTKEEIVNSAHKSLPNSVHFLGGHPMTGSEKRGLPHADPLLFENAVYVLTDNQQLPSELTDKFVELIRAIGAQVLFMSAKQHDRIAAVVSHLPQLLAVTLMKYASNINNNQNSTCLKLAAGGFRDMTRIASSPYEVWRDILVTNADNIRASIARFHEELTFMEGLLHTSELQDIFDEAAKNRLSIPRDTRGFLNSHYDISVVVEDKPGVIADISTALAEEELNIKDIEILKVREGEAGTMRLAFESEGDREQAIELLENYGYQSIKRD